MAGGRDDLGHDPVLGDGADRRQQVSLRVVHRAVFLFFSAIVGAAGPFVTGLISDALKVDLGNMSLGRALFVVPAMQVLAVVFYVVASRRFVREIVD